MADTTASAGALTFQFPAYQLRTVMRDGEPWFAAIDICAALGIDNNRNATARLDDDEKDVHSMDTPSGFQEITIVNESGLYSLILGSRKPEAKKFKKWVTAEVLPAIRRTGRYVATQAAPASSVPAVGLPAGLEMAQQLLADLRAMQTQLIAALQEGQRATAGQVKLHRRLEREKAKSASKDKVALAIAMERRGEPRERIRIATGLSFNHLRQIYFRARAAGELPPVAEAPPAAKAQASLNLEGACHA